MGAVQVKVVAVGLVPKIVSLAIVPRVGDEVDVDGEQVMISRVVLLPLTDENGVAAIVYG